MKQTHFRETRSVLIQKLYSYAGLYLRSGYQKEQKVENYRDVFEMDILISYITLRF